MKRLIGIALAIALGTTGTAFAQGTGTEVMVGVDASEWTSDTVLDIPGGIFPVGGGGQLNGEFTIVTRDGSEIGLRATDRVDGLLTATGMRKGFYTASTGYDTGTTNRAEWNYDIHVDLRGTGTELSDYDLTLNQTFVNKLLGSAGPFDLTFPDFTFGVLDNAVLYQLSFNPVFFNDTFDVFAEDTYDLVLTLSPKAGGPPLKAHIQVIVSAE